MGCICAAESSVNKNLPKKPNNNIPLDIPKRPYVATTYREPPKVYRDHCCQWCCAQFRTMGAVPQMSLPRN